MQPTPQPLPSSPDPIDDAAGLTPVDSLFALRRTRPDFVEGASACRQAVIRPRADHGLSERLRTALAERMTRLNGDAALAATYAAELAGLAPEAELLAVAEGGSADHGEPRLQAMVRHVDLITNEPGKATRADIVALVDAGLTGPQIVALSELIAFVNFEVRVVAALRLMKG